MTPAAASFPMASRAANCVRLKRCSPKVAATERARPRTRSSTASREAPTRKSSVPAGNERTKRLARFDRSAAENDFTSESMIANLCRQKAERNSTVARLRFTPLPSARLLSNSSEACRLPHRLGYYTSTRSSSLPRICLRAFRFWQGTGRLRFEFLHLRALQQGFSPYRQRGKPPLFHQVGYCLTAHAPQFGGLNLGNPLRRFEPAFWQLKIA